MKISDILSRSQKLPISIIGLKDNLEFNRAYYKSKAESNDQRIAEIRETITSIKDREDEDILFNHRWEPDHIKDPDFGSYLKTSQNSFEDQLKRHFSRLPDHRNNIKSE